MRVRNWILLGVMALLAVFSGLNWAELSESEPLNLGLFSYPAVPLGLIQMGLMLALLLGYFFYAAALEASVLSDVRKLTREVEASRKLADDAEASRFSELRKYLEGELGRLKMGGADLSPLLQRLEKLEGNLQQKMDGLENNLRQDVEKAGNTLAAYIGELEDQLLPNPPRQ